MPMLDIRADLNAAPYTRSGAAPYFTRPRDGIEGVVLHYTASPRTTTVWTVARYQTGPNAQEAFPAIAYHLYVSYDGTIYLCHDLETRVWHSGAVVDGVSRNRSHIGICYAGNVEPNAAQLDGLHEAIVWCETELGRSLDIEGHRDAPYATNCPGPTWPAWRLAMLPRGAGMTHAELLELGMLMETAWNIQSNAAPQVRRALRRGAAYARDIATAAGYWKRALNLAQRASGKPLTS